MCFISPFLKGKESGDSSKGEVERENQEKIGQWVSLRFVSFGRDFFKKRGVGGGGASWPSGFNVREKMYSEDRRENGAFYC